VHPNLASFTCLLCPLACCLVHLLRPQSAICLVHFVQSVQVKEPIHKCTIVGPCGFQHMNAYSNVPMTFKCSSYHMDVELQYMLCSILYFLEDRENDTYRLWIVQLAVIFLSSNGVMLHTSKKIYIEPDPQKTQPSNLVFFILIDMIKWVYNVPTASCHNIKKLTCNGLSMIGIY